MQTKKISFRAYYGILTVLLILSLIVAVRVGAVNMGYEKIFLFIQRALGFRRDVGVNSVEEQLFLQIRLPRVILCALVGAALSVSGTLMQALFRNPIVEPGLVGTSSGAAFGAAFVFVMGKSLSGTWMDALGPFLLPLFAFAGGLIATWTVYRL